MVFPSFARSSQPLFSQHIFTYLPYYQYIIFKIHATPLMTNSRPNPCAVHIFILILPAD